MRTVSISGLLTPLCGAGSLDSTYDTQVVESHCGATLH
jgi:hypothetical protein